MKTAYKFNINASLNICTLGLERKSLWRDRSTGSVEAGSSASSGAR
ncbi:MAG: hypothetical protein QUS07_09250 [Methanothrix sp.]|nr:hypothetical protein [Methanothrix sp.]